MLRLAFLLIVAVMAALASWQIITTDQGTVEITWFGTQVETTALFGLLLLVLAVAVATPITRAVAGESVFAVQLAARGIDLARARARAPSRAIMVADVMTPGARRVDPATPAGELRAQMHGARVDERHGHHILRRKRKAFAEGD